MYQISRIPPISYKNTHISDEICVLCRRFGLKWRFIPSQSAVLLDKVYKFEDHRYELGGKAALSILNDQGVHAVHTTCYEQKTKVMGLKAANAFFNPKYYDPNRRTLTKPLVHLTDAQLRHEMRALIYLAVVTNRSLILPNVLGDEILQLQLHEEYTGGKSRRFSTNGKLAYRNIEVLDTSIPAAASGGGDNGDNVNSRGSGKDREARRREKKRRKRQMKRKNKGKRNGKNRNSNGDGIDNGSREGGAAGREDDEEREEEREMEGGELMINQGDGHQIPVSYYGQEAEPEEDCESDACKSDTSIDDDEDDDSVDDDSDDVDSAAEIRSLLFSDKTGALQASLSRPIAEAAEEVLYRYRALWPGFRIAFFMKPFAERVDLLEPGFYWRVRREYATFRRTAMHKSKNFESGIRSDNREDADVNNYVPKPLVLSFPYALTEVDVGLSAASGVESSKRGTGREGTPGRKITQLLNLADVEKVLLSEEFREAPRLVLHFQNRHTSKALWTQAEGHATDEEKEREEVEEEEDDVVLVQQEREKEEAMQIQMREGREFSAEHDFSARVNRVAADEGSRQRRRRLQHLLQEQRTVPGTHSTQSPPLSYRVSLAESDVDTFMERGFLARERDHDNRETDGDTAHHSSSSDITNNSSDGGFGGSSDSWRRKLIRESSRISARIEIRKQLQHVVRWASDSVGSYESYAVESSRYTPVPQVDYRIKLSAQESDLRRRSVFSVLDSRDRVFWYSYAAGTAHTTAELLDIAGVSLSSSTAAVAEGDREGAALRDEGGVYIARDFESGSSSRVSSSVGLVRAKQWVGALTEPRRGQRIVQYTRLCKNIFDPVLGNRSCFDKCD